MKRLFFTSLLITILATYEVSYSRNGYEWVGRCREGMIRDKDITTESMVTVLNNELYCDSFIEGAVFVGESYAIEFEKAGLKEVKLFCLPKDYRIRQIRNTITRYMETHPSILEKQDFESIRIAFKGAYPCEK